MHQVWVSSDLSSDSSKTDRTCEQSATIVRLNASSSSTPSHSSSSCSGAEPSPPAPEFGPASSTGDVISLVNEQQLPEGMPSRGSLKHATGRCTPCHFFHSKAGCKLGKRCGFCHLEVEGRARPNRRRRAKAKSQIDNLPKSENPEDQQRLHEFESRGGYFQELTKAREKREQREMRERQRRQGQLQSEHESEHQLEMEAQRSQLVQL